MSMSNAFEVVTRLLLVFFCWILSLTVHAQILTESDEVFKVAGQTHRPVLIVFAGSDWCAPCVRFEKNVLDKTSFREFAQNSLIVYQADFPQRKKLPKDVQKRNEALAEKYNPRGQFPQLVLVRNNEEVISVVNYRDESAEEFIKKLRLLIDHEQGQGVSQTN